MPLPTMTRGIQLAFAVNVVNVLNAANPQPSETPAPHRPCPVCAGPTARVGRHVACALCGYGTRERPRGRAARRRR